MRAARGAWLLLISSVLVALAACTGGGGAQQAQSNANSIRICHSTGSASNPFVEQSPSKDGTVDGHDNHPNDIIPPFDYLDNSGNAQH